MAKKGLWVSISLFVALFAQHAGASTLDFEDLTFGASYGVGESFATSGVVITGEEFFFLPSGSTLDGSVSVGDVGLAAVRDSGPGSACRMLKLWSRERA